jgi:glycosyltransferase involved in cell wall biosynthesis
MKKIKVFLGGYTNFTNAQNLNCKALARYLDKSKFDIYTLEIYSGDLKTNTIQDIHTFNMFYPHRISIYIGYLWGIWKCDVAYLPKGELDGWNRFWLKMLRKKSFKTVEGIYDEKNLASAIAHKGSYEKMMGSFTYFDRVYSITKYLKEYNFRQHKIKSESKILYLGSDIDIFINLDKSIDKLKNIIYIGRLFKRKGIYEFLTLAKIYPNLKFHIVGEGSEEESVKAYIDEHTIQNIVLHGRLDHVQLAKLLKDMDLHIFPSRSEGFPKVTLETAASGVPSIVYSDYGASEWLTDHKDGFVVDTFDEMLETIVELLNNDKLLQTTSRNAIDMAKHFDWKVLVKEWENEIMSIYHE